MFKPITLLLSLILTAPALMADTNLHSALEQAATGKHRSEANIARNQHRHPVETLSFFGLEKGMTVIEISPGGMWYTEVLAPALKGNGTFIAAGFDTEVKGAPGYHYRLTALLEDRIAKEPVFSEVKIAKFSPPTSIQLGEKSSADMVLTFRNTHGWVRDGIAETAYQSFYDVLKPGGILGVVQHRGPAKRSGFTGYVTEQKVIELAEKAGFVLEEKSEINANPKDIKDYPENVWTLPPSLRLGEKNQEKYLAIGESDRMTLRFRKPK